MNVIRYAFTGCTTPTRRYAAGETRQTVAGFSEEDINDTVSRAVQSVCSQDRIKLQAGANRAVLIVEDVVDTGLSMQHMLAEVQALHPRSVRVCALFFKPGAFKGDYKVDYVGREIGNEFIVGYGLDYNERGRNLPEVMVVSDK